jgi:transcriptional regulator with XRE-family HTH domain
VTACDDARKPGPGAQGKMPEVGPVGRNLIANVEYLRQVRRLSQRKLSAELDRIGRPIAPLGLSRLVRGQRRVDVDELVALAGVLGVTPDVLLSPPEAVRQGPAPVPAALREARNLASRIEDLLEAAGDPAAREFAAGGVDRALRRVQIEVEELLEQQRRGAHDC